MPSKSEKIAENCTFFFVDSIKCYVRIAKWGLLDAKRAEQREQAAGCAKQKV